MLDKNHDELHDLTAEIEERVDIDNQLTQLAEEASELAQAALKYRRALQTARCDTGISPTPNPAVAAHFDLIEEASDVSLSLMVLGEGFTSSGIMLKKANRWLARLKEYDTKIHEEGQM